MTATSGSKLLVATRRRVLVVDPAAATTAAGAELAARPSCLAIEAGALVTSPDGGRTWRDRMPGGPYDTHQLAIHPERPDWLRAAAGDGYFESPDGGATWASPQVGLGAGYLVSAAIDPGDPEVVVVSAASGPYSAYMAGRADGRLYRRAGQGRWSASSTAGPTRR